VWACVCGFVRAYVCACVCECVRAHACFCAPEDRCVVQHACIPASQRAPVRKRCMAQSLVCACNHQEVRDTPLT